MLLSSSDKLKVMVVDDEIDIANVLKKLFMKMGFDAIAFTDPLIALEHFDLNCYKFELIMVDLRMPGTTGLDFANKIRKKNSTVRIFLITAFDITDLENNNSFKNAKIERIIQKPIRYALLKKIIDQTLFIENKIQMLNNQI
jgi:response regulator RpfG family c-di-GMP phosphodiesterase